MNPSNSNYSQFEAVLIRGAKISRYLLVLIAGIFTAMLSPVLAIIISGLFVFALAKRKKALLDTHGRASWAETNELMNSNLLFQTTGFFIGRAVGLGSLPMATVLTALLFCPLRRSRKAIELGSIGMNGSPESRNVLIPTARVPHVAVFGASGSGKSTCFAIQQILSDQKNGLVVLDPKGELATLTASYLKKRGQKVHIFDPFKLSSSDETTACTFNPLSFFWGNQATIVDESRRLASALVQETGEEKDPFWINSSRVLITATLSFLMAHANKKDCNLNNAREILSSSDLMQDMLTRMQQSEACGFLLRRLANQVLQLEGQTKSSVYSVANSHIEFLDSLPIAESLSKTSLDAKHLLDGKSALFVCLPVDRINELAGVQRLILTAIINRIFAAGENRERTIRFVLDESATLGPMESLYGALNFGRSFGMNLMFLFQSISQVERCFPKSQRNDFFGTTATVFAGVNDLSTAKEVSDWIGQSTVVSVSNQRSDNWGKSASSDTANLNVNTNWGSNRSTSSNEVARPLLRPEEVLQLSPKLAIGLVPNVPPILLEKVPYFEKQRRRGLVAKAWSISTSCLLISITLLLLSLMIWAIASGQLVPAIQDLRESFLDSLG